MVLVDRNLDVVPPLTFDLPKNRVSTIYLLTKIAMNWLYSIFFRDTQLALGTSASSLLPKSLSWVAPNRINQLVYICRLTDTQIRAHTHYTYTLYIHIIQTYVYIHTYLPPYLPTYLPTYLQYIPTYIRTYVHTCTIRTIRTYVHTYIRTHVHTHIHTHTHIYIYTYTHVHL